MHTLLKVKLPGVTEYFDPPLKILAWALNLTVKKGPQSPGLDIIFYLNLDSIQMVRYHTLEHVEKVTEGQSFLWKPVSPLPLSKIFIGTS